MTKFVDLWLVEGYESSTLVASFTFPRSWAGERQITVMLERLAARHLTAREIVEASRRPVQRTTMLHVHSSGPESGGRPTFEAGDATRYSATIIRAADVSDWVAKGWITKPGAKTGITTNRDDFFLVKSQL